MPPKISPVRTVAPATATPATTTPAAATRASMAGKPVGFLPSASVLSNSKGFIHKKLTDGPVLNMGDACVYSCKYCYVPAMAYRRLYAPKTFAKHSPALRAFLSGPGKDHQAIVLKRCGNTPAITGLNLLDANLAKLSNATKVQKLVCFTSTSVDPAANIADATETAAALEKIFGATNWDVRILSKSNLLPEIAKMVSAKYKNRMIFGVSAGTINDALAASMEINSPLVSQRIESLHWLQDNKYRTFGMICPSLPQANPAAYDKFSKEVCRTIRVSKCEHVWAEPMNIRGKSVKKTIDALNTAGFTTEADALTAVSGPGKKSAWEAYAQATFNAHKINIPSAKLRFLHYPSKAAHAWWMGEVANGAIVLN